MEGAGFRTLIVFFLLAILAFIAGSLASENAGDALVPAALILGAFFLLYLGKNCWMLLFILPPICSVLNISLGGVAVEFLIAIVILVYMIFLNMMGYLKLRWNSLVVLDILSLLFCGYVIATWIRYPITLEMFTSITDSANRSIGAAPYVCCVAAVFYYIAMSILDIKVEDIIKTLKWSFILTLIASIIVCIKGLVTGNTQVGEEIATSRFGAFMVPARHLFYYFTAKYSLIGIMLSPWKLVVIGMCLIGVAFSGFRTSILLLALYMVFVSIWKKQFLFLMFLIGFTWGSIVYLSHEEKLDSLPHGVQRVLSAVPGVDLGKDNVAAKDAQGSIDWRYEMWQWAMDPSKGYIDDYVWGDGIGLSLYKEKLLRITIGFGIRNAGDNEIFAARKMWHSTIISLIQAFGYVGLTIAMLWFFYSGYVAVRVLSGLKSTKGKEFAYIALIPLLGYITIIPVLTLAPGGFLNFFSYAALAKLLFVVLKRDGEIKPLFKGNDYVPLMLEQEPVNVRHIQNQEKSEQPIS